MHRAAAWSRHQPAPRCRRAGESRAREHATTIHQVITLGKLRHSNISRIRRASPPDVVTAWHGHAGRMTQAVHGRPTDDRGTAAANGFSPELAHKASSGPIRLTSKTRSDAARTDSRVELRGFDTWRTTLMPKNARPIHRCGSLTAHAHRERDTKWGGLQI